MMRNCIPGVLFLFIAYFSSAQGDYHNLISKGKFAKAEEKLKSDYQKEPASVSTNFSLASLFIIHDFPSYNPDSAYYFCKEAEYYFRKSDEKELKKIARDDIRADTIARLKNIIIQDAFQMAENKNTIPGFNHFIDYYPDAEPALKNRCRTHIHQLAFDIAKERNSIEGFNEFIRSYPAADQVPRAVGLRNQIAFNDASGINTTAGYQKFIRVYPDAVQVPQAWNKIYTIEYDFIKSNRDSKAFKDYLQKYPQSPLAEVATKRYEWLFFVEETIPGDAGSYERFIDSNPRSVHIGSAIDSLVAFSNARSDYLPLMYLLENHSEKTDSQQLMNMLFRYVALDGELSAFNWFKEEFPGFENSDILETGGFIAQSIASVDLRKLTKETIPAVEQYIKEAAPCRQAYKALLALSRSRIDARDWSSAAILVNKYEPFFRNDPGYQALAEMLKEKINTDIKRHSFGPLVNAKEGSAYVPTISGDFEHLYFCGRDRTDNLGGEDIYESLNSSNGWQKPRLIDELSTSSTNDAPLNVSTDGTQMLIFKSGVIHTTEKLEQGWSEPERVPEPVNTGPWNADAMYTSDGQAMLFTSQRTGGYNFETDVTKCVQYPTDIYISFKEGEGWSEPLNMGPVINTSGCERTPFLHPDMKTLYFSSDGHGGFGNLDVYKTTRLNDSSWTAWSKPENLGKEVNGSGSDWGYKISTDGTKAYFSEGEETKDKRTEGLYWINLPPRMRPDYVATVKGQLKTPDNKPIQAKLIWEDLTTGKIIGEAQSDPVTGGFFIVLPLGKIYGYHVDKTDFFPISGNIDLRKTITAVEKLDTIRMVTFREMSDKGIALPINNLFFNFAEKTLLPYSIPELNRVADIIKKHRLVVEIAGHTDNVGDSAFNIQLSLGRANSVKSFLTEHGCNEGDLKILGFGQEQPVADNITDAGRAKNRRVEMKIIQR